MDSADREPLSFGIDIFSTELCKIANNVDPDLTALTAPIGAVLSGSILFAKA